MRIITSTKWILALLLFFTSNFVTQAQTLDATFSSPLTNQCAGSLFTLNATTTTYQGYSWTIEGPNNFSNTSTGTTSALYLTEPGTYNVSLSVTDGASTETNTVSGFLNVATPATVNAGVDQTVCANTLVMLNGAVGGSATLITWSGGTGTFSTNSYQVTTYTPSPSEIGIVNLILTTNDPAGPCAADQDTVMIIINQVPTVTAPSSICVGSTAQLSPSSGGTWNSSNAAKAIINNSGLATGTGAGVLTFMFTNTATGCYSETSTVTVNPLPTVTLSANTVCVNGTVQLTPSFGGTWITYNSSVAIVTSSGLVTGLAQGTTTIIFTNSTTGCSKTSENLNVGLGTNPVLSVPTAFCDGTTVQLLPSSGGTWTSNMPARAVVTNNGIASALSAGYVTFTYVNTVTGCSATSSQVQVYGLQQVSMPNSQLCVNSTMQLSPNSGGTWVSSNPSIASITNNGLVTCLSQGTVNFTFTNTSTGCAGTTNNLTVNPLPIITLSSNTICVNSSIQISTNYQGSTFNISNPSVAWFGANGITGIAEGTFIIAVMNPIGCMTTSEQITVTSNATVNPIPNQIVCAGDSTTPITFSGSGQQYNWTNDNTSTGLAASGTGNTAGFVTTNPTATNQIATITVTPVSSICNATPSTFTITVKPTPVINSIPDQIKCSGMYSDAVNFSGNLSNTTYTWSRTNTTISISPIATSATGNIPSFLTDNPVLTQISSIFSVTPSLNGCTGSPTNFTITVLPPPLSTISSSSVCVNGSVSLTPNSGGTWTSSNTSVATVTPSGIVSIINVTTSQICILRYTETTTGCYRDHELTVNPRPFVTSPASICNGSTGQLSPSTGGAWVSNNPSIASISISGLVTGLATGTVNFTFTNTTTGCSNNTPPITVNSRPTFTLSKTDPTTCNGTNGTINILGLTPNTSYQYSYVLPNVSNGPITTTSNSSGQITIFGLSAGTYTLSILHPASGCQSATQDITLVNPNAPNINDIQDQVLCGTSYSLPAITGTNLTGNQAYYTGPNGTGSVISTGTVISSTSTIYMYTSTIGGCIDEESFTVTIHSQPTVSAPASLCVGSTAQLSPSFGGTWITNNPSIASISSSGLVTGTAEGIASFSFTSTATGCSTTSSNLTVTSNATVDPIPDQIVCAGDSTTSITFSGSAQQYNWTNDNTSIGLAASGTGNVAAFTAINTALSNQVATITVTPISSSCNATTTTFTITVIPLPTVNPVADQIVCHNQAIQAIVFSSSMPNSVYSWTQDNILIGCPQNGSSNIPPFIATNTTPTTQLANFVVYPSMNGCYGDAMAFSITVNPNSTITLSSNSVCVNSTVELTPNSGGNWVSNNQSIASITNAGLVTGLATGTVNFTFTNSTTGCISTTNNLTVNPLPMLNPIPDQVVCHNDFTQAINFTSSIQNSTYNWNNNNSLIGLNQTGISPISSFQAQNTSGVPQIATITVNVSGNGCQNSINFSITVNPSASINPIPDQIVCAGDSITPITFSGSAQQYNWTNNSVSIGLEPSGTGNITGFIATNPTAANQISTITVTPINGSCNSTPTTFTITVKPMPTVDTPQNQTRCHNDSTLTINFSGAINGTDYNWTNSNASIGCAASGTGDIPSFQVQNTTFGSQIANFVVTPSLNGCLGSAINFNITVLPLPIVNAGNDTIICFGENYTPIAAGIDLLFTWDNGVFDNTPFTPTSTNTYTLIGVDLNGCSNSDSITVTVNSVPQLTISTFDGEDSLACDGTLTVLVTDGTAPYSYTWINGATNYTTPAIQDLCSGTYALSVVDANGCSATNSSVINDTLIPVIVGDTLIFTDNIYQDSTIIGADTSDWIENCTFDYDLVTSATISSYVDNGSSTIVTWLISLSDGSTIPIEATYNLSPGTAGVYDLTLQLTCSQKSDPKFLVANSRLYYEGSTIGIQSNSLSAVHLYPNPAKSTLSISGINESFQYEIRDIQGKLLKQGANNKQIEIENLPAGTYVIGISTDSEVNQLRFVKL